MHQTNVVASSSLSPQITIATKTQQTRVVGGRDGTQ